MTRKNYSENLKSSKYKLFKSKTTSLHRYHIEIQVIKNV